MRPAVFIDTSAYLAVLKRDDYHHREALAVVESLTRQRAALFTSNCVIAETHAILLRYLGHEPARTYLQAMDDSRATVIERAQATDEAAARSIIYRYVDKDFSLTDAISFAIMARLGLRQAFTFDKHFEQYGWRVLHT
jgi:predicted nucleic acid-binding protein